MPHKFQLNRLAVIALAACGFFPLQAAPLADSETPESGLILEQYLKAAKASQDAMRGMTMSVEMHATIPRLDREGGMKATRTVSATGEVSYSGMTFDGHDSIKRDVIARFLQADVEASKQAAIGITPANYKFKHWGLYGTGDWQLHLFELTPKRKAPGLFKGWIWVEAKTGLPVREEGPLCEKSVCVSEALGLCARL